MDTTIATYDKIARRYSDAKFNQDMKKQHGYFMKYKKGKKVLDAGCGHGRDTKYFLSKGLSVVGIDLSTGLLKEAKSRVPNGKFIKMDIRNLKFKDSYFDCIWSNACLLHLRKTQINRTLKGFNRVLKENGLLFVSLKKGNGEGYKTYSDGTKRFFAFYNEKEIFGIVRKNGFEVLKSYSALDNDGDVFINTFCRKVKPPKAKT